MLDKHFQDDMDGAINHTDVGHELEPLATVNPRLACAESDPGCDHIGHDGVTCRELPLNACHG
jgi:hypothetical protein